MITPLREAFFEAASESGTPAIDAQRLFAQESRGGLVGDDQLVDHIHPSIAGHQRLANALADELIREGVLAPAASWRQARDLKYEEHLAQLDTAYYVEGKRRLEGLRTWAEGRVPHDRPKERPE